VNALRCVQADANGKKQVKNDEPDQHDVRSLNIIVRWILAALK